MHGECSRRSTEGARRERAGADGQRQDRDAPHCCRPLLPAAPLGDQRTCARCFCHLQGGLSTQSPANSKHAGGGQKRLEEP